VSVAETGSKTILLVEDEAIVAISERLLLEKAGFRVLVSSTGEDALELFREDESVDLVLMDIDLGAGIDGTEAAERMLEIRELPVLFLTSHSEKEMVDRVKGITRYGYVLKSSGKFVLLESISMAFELFEAHRAMAEEIDIRANAEALLAERTTFIETILDNLPIGLSVNYIDEGRAVYMNRRFQEIYGWPNGVLTNIAHFFEHLYPDPEYRAQVAGRVMEDIASGDPARMHWEDIRITREDGTTAVVSATNIPIYEQNFMISTVEDVTERATTSELYRNIVRTATEGFLLVGPRGRIVEANDAYRRMTGYTAEDLARLSVSDIDAAERPEETGDHIRRILDEGSDRFLSRHRRKDGSILDVDVSVTAAPAAGDLMVCFVRDASEAQAAQNALSQDNRALQEELVQREVLNREINHRIKNNLSLITGLLRLKQDGLPPDVDLSDVVHRIDAIRILYDRLQLGDSVSEVDFGRYLSDLLGHLFESLSPEPVALEVSADALSVSPRRAVPLGIITVEIATNAVKHAFGAGVPRRFTAKVSVGESTCSLKLSNSGTPFPEDVELGEVESLGMRIVLGLVDQIGGTLVLHRTPETTFQIQFPRKESLA
jgi:PAS domain S-box-containing protein